MARVLDGFTVIFDLDGTLIDTAPDLLRALNEVTSADGFPPASLEDVRHMVGRGARALLMRAYARSGASFPEPGIDRRVALFIERYAEDIARSSAPFDGACAAMDQLSDMGARLVIATNKPQRLTDQLLGVLKLSARFANVVGADAAPVRKPHPSHLEAALGEGARERAVMIGDSSVDVAAARNFGVPVIVMSHGYTETPPALLGADGVLDHFEDLPDAVIRLASGAKVSAETADAPD